jgi:hypothetical protein
MPIFVENPCPNEVKNYLREIEEPYFTGLRNFGEFSGKVGYSGKAFTGERLCPDGSYVIKKALENRFGEGNWIWIAYSRVSPIWSSGEGLPHYRPHFIGSDEEEYFIDPTFGQVSLLNKIVMDYAENEQYYYDSLNTPVRKTIPDTEDSLRLLKYFPTIFTG